MIFSKLLKSSVLAVSLAAAISAPAFAAGELDEIKDNGILRVGVKNAVVGFSFQDPLTGEYTGLEDDLALMIADELGVDVEFTAVTAATRSELIDSGDLDIVLATFTITPERIKNWDFTTPYFTDHVSVLVEDKNNIKHLSDLVGKKVGVSSGSTSAQSLVEAMIANKVIEGKDFNKDTFDPSTWTEGVTFQQYDDYPTISTALSANEIQAFCVDKSILAIYKTNGRSYIDAEFAPQEYGAVTKKGSDLSKFADDLVKKWLSDGTIEELISKHNLD